MQSPQSAIRHINQYRFLQQDVIGQGASGKVYLGINTQTNQRVAIKTIDMDTIDNEVTRYLLESEKQALTAIKSPYVLHAIEVIQNNEFCYLITEYFHGGTLREKITSNKHAKKGATVFQQIQALQILQKLTLGLCAIQQKGFVHRDIKTANILFRGKDPIIIDFGYCDNQKGNKPQMYYNVGSPSYMSPQAYKKCQYSPKSDMWALGIIFYQMLIGVPMDYGLDIKKFFAEIQKPGGLNFTSAVPKSCQMLLALMLKINPIQRVDPLQLLKPIQLSMQNVNKRAKFTSQTNVFYRPENHSLLKLHKHQIQNVKINQSLIHGKNLEKTYQHNHQQSFDGLLHNVIQQNGQKIDADIQKNIAKQDPYQHRNYQINNRRNVFFTNIFDTKQELHPKFKPQTSNQYQIQRIPIKINNAGIIQNHIRQSLSPKNRFSVSPKRKNQIPTRKLQLQTRFDIRQNQRQFKTDKIEETIVLRGRKLQNPILQKSLNQQTNLVITNKNCQREQIPIFQRQSHKMRVCNSKPDLQVQQKDLSRQVAGQKRNAQKGPMFQSAIITLSNKNNEQVLSDFIQNINFRPWQINQRNKTGFMGVSDGRFSLQYFKNAQHQQAQVEQLNSIQQALQEQQKRHKIIELRDTIISHTIGNQQANKLVKISYPHHYYTTNQQNQEPIKINPTNVVANPNVNNARPVTNLNKAENVKVNFGKNLPQTSLQPPKIAVQGKNQPIRNNMMQQNYPFKVSTNHPQNIQNQQILVIKKPEMQVSAMLQNQLDKKNGIFNQPQTNFLNQQPKHFITITTQNQNRFKSAQQKERVQNNNIRI